MSNTTDSANAATAALPLAPGSEIRVAKSAMTDRIYAGRVCKDGMTWRDGKRDVTSDVLKAVVDLITPGHALTISVDGKPAYEITVKALPSPNAGDEARRQKTNSP